MTQTTIKEKFEETLRGIALEALSSAEVEDHELHNKHGEEERSRNLLIDFAQLICDEMTGDLQNHDPGYTGNPDMLSGITVGHNEQVYWERFKAQEILKALG